MINQQFTKMDLKAVLNAKGKEHIETSNIESLFGDVLSTVERLIYAMIL